MLFQHLLIAINKLQYITHKMKNHAGHFITCASCRCKLCNKQYLSTFTLKIFNEMYFSYPPMYNIILKSNTMPWQISNNSVIVEINERPTVSRVK